ncbi:MAG: hypothetical protein RBR99_04120, partial [Dehalococcoidales bacterium]|nr:hypothetical protein [Dehalococcoidales bacterium]
MGAVRSGSVVGLEVLLVQVLTLKVHGGWHHSLGVLAAKTGTACLVPDGAGIESLPDLELG